MSSKSETVQASRTEINRWIASLNPEQSAALDDYTQAIIAKEHAVIAYAIDARKTYAAKVANDSTLMNRFDQSDPLRPL